MDEFTYGVTIEKNGQKYKSVTGRAPSPANPDAATVISNVLDFLNGHFGTNFIAVESFDLEDLEEVAPGEYQRKDR